jgi:uncharacterized protein YjiS (DUF1127 family)
MSKPLVQGSARTLAQISSGYAFFQQDGSPSPAGSWMDALCAWSARGRERRALRELTELGDHFLEDIGVSREEALREAAKSFWQR